LYDTCEIAGGSDEIEIPPYRLYTGQAREQANTNFRKTKRSTSHAHQVSVSDIVVLSLNSGKGRQTSISGKKRRADNDLRPRQEQAPSQVEIANPSYSSNLPYTTKSEKVRSKPHDARLYTPKRGPRQSASQASSSQPEHLSDWLVS
jgi:hypothetical protein